jgi:hypothetical protein
MTTNREWFSTRELTIGLAAGILKADPFFRGYEPPPGYERVLRDFAKSHEQYEDFNGCFESDTEIVRSKIFEFVYTHPICKSWNEWDGASKDTIAFTSRYSPRPNHREFIDLDAIGQNTWAAICESREAFKRFNDDFNARHNHEASK